MALSTAQKNILNKIMELGPQTVKELAISTGYSVSFVRAQVESMLRHELKVDKKRQPFVYDVSEHSMELKYRSDVRKVRDQLVGRADVTNSFVKVFKDKRKETWSDVAYVLECTARAIRELETDGELIDTL